MEYYKYVFVIVTYRNTQDIVDCVRSIKNTLQDSYKIIIVNNFFDKNSSLLIGKFADENGCIFIEADNRGYGAGNNIAIDFSINNFKFEYLIVSNPDIIIEEFDSQQIEGKQGIFAPYIHNKVNKIQNPMEYKYNRFATRLVYEGLKRDNKVYLYMGLAIKSIIRIIGYTYIFFRSNLTKIYMAHGCFLIFDYETVKRLNPVYDENIFLFAEESYLAIRAKKNKINTYYTKKIKIFHKEDGSMGENIHINKWLAESNIYVYENYNMERKK